MSKGTTELHKAGMLADSYELDAQGGVGQGRSPADGRKGTQVGLGAMPSGDLGQRGLVDRGPRSERAVRY